jgi:anti-sigma factor RsiW
MKYKDFHLSDEQLLGEIDGELSAQDEKLARSHLDACFKCRARQQNLENAAVRFIRPDRRRPDARIPSSDWPRALLKARLRQISEANSESCLPWPRFAYSMACAAAIGGLLAVALAVLPSRTQRYDPRHRTMAVFSLPDSRLTPGAASLIDQREVCADAGTNNKAVTASVQRQVFEEYRIDGADPRAYEVDYLITPALGGADDIRNLWPHSYSATVWNAQIKDALENHLRDLVCGGKLDLGEAQREIATNWIAAYKKYFRTDEPLSEHRREHE